MLYVNSIHRCWNKFRFYLFADDTNILYKDKNLKDLDTIVNSKLQNLYNSLTANKLTLNINKSNFVIFHPYQKRLAYQPKLCMFDNEKNKYVRLESKVDIKYLGIKYQNLSWNTTFILFLKKFVKCWANVLLITFLYYESVSASMHDINNDKAPANMLNLFQKTSNLHLHNAGSSTSGKFYVKSSRLEIQNNFLSRLGVKLWNKIPRYITDLPKKALRKLLFYIFEKEDDHFQIPAIIKKVGTQIHLLKVLMSAFLFLCYHCTSVSAVLIRSLNFGVLFIFSCNLQGFLIVLGFCFY